MKIIYVGTEALPYYKVGGLGDVLGSLPYEIKKLGHDVTVVLPYFSFLKEHPSYVARNDVMGFDIYTLENNGVTVYFIKNTNHFTGDRIYTGNDVEDAGRYSYFSRAVIETAKQLNLEPDVVHINDWHVAFIPIYYSDYEVKPKTVFTIHNLAFQGIFEPGLMPELNIPHHKYHMEALEYYNKINIMKGGIVFSDFVTTVSNTYAEEIKGDEYGFGLQGVLQKYSGKLKGVLNGLDYELFNPETDKEIPANYSTANTKGKKICKEKLQEELGLKVGRTPVFGMVTRLFEQKGLDIVLEAMEEIKDMNMQLVILGSGKKEFEEKFMEYAAKYSDKIAVKIGFDVKLAQRIYAGCDFYLMPSKFEPCGLSQLIAMRYGTIPVVRSVGGLKDTVKDGKTGFVFDGYSKDEIIKSLKRAQDVYFEKEKYERIMTLAMTSDFSWGRSAKEYENIYKGICQ